MQIDSLAISQGPTAYYNDSLHKVFETFIQWLIKDSNTYQLGIDQQTAYKYENDFFGLLLSLNIPANLHWIILRMNNFVSPLDCGPNITSILVPGLTAVDFIRQSYMSTNIIS